MAAERDAWPQRLQARQDSERRRLARALQVLAGALDPGADPGEDVDSWVAVLRAVSAHLGMPVAIPPSRRWRDHRRPYEAMADASRLRLRRVTLRGEWWERDAGPLAARTRAGAPVALLPAGGRYVLYDPATEVRTPVDPLLAQSLDPTAYQLYRKLPDVVRGASGLLAFALADRRRELVALGGYGLALTLLGLLTPLALGFLIDGVIPAGDRGLLWQIGGGLAAVALGQLGFQLAQGLTASRLETLADLSTQSALWDRLLALPLTFFRQYPAGDLLSRVSIVAEIRRKLGSLVLGTLLGSAFSLLNLGAMLVYDLRLAGAAALLGLVSLTLTVVSGLLLSERNRKLLRLRGTLFGFTVQLVNGIARLRSASAERRAFTRWLGAYTAQTRIEHDAQRIEDFVATANTFLPTVAMAVVFALAAPLVQQGKLSTGSFLAFNTLLGSFLAATANLSLGLVDIVEVTSQVRRAQPLLAATPEVDALRVDPGILRGHLSLEGVSFRYRPTGAPVLDGVTLRAEPGEFVALVGPSGSGKSTVLRLLLGLETPGGGTVRVDGQDLSRLDVQAVRNQIGAVLQESRLVAGSLFENIAYGYDASEQEVWEAARLAGIAEEIAAMPMQLQTMVSEGGGNLSGGQRQRVFIARALVRRPRIVLFDEATSALDNRTQALVTASLDALKVTRLVIAHRLSTIRNADRIYVLAAGRVVQEGNFEELAAQPGLFAQLIARQQLG